MTPDNIELDAGARNILLDRQRDECLNNSDLMTCELDEPLAAYRGYHGRSPCRTSTMRKSEGITGHDQDCGWDGGSFAKYNQSSLSWKTAQCSLLADLEQSLEIWPEWGWMRDGECLELQPLERAITERGFSWLLTPTAHSWRAWTFRNPLALIRKNHADGNLQEQLMRLYRRMTTPRCQEILMMWPEGWTDSKPLAMDGFQKWRQEQ